MTFHPLNLSCVACGERFYCPDPRKHAGSDCPRCKQGTLTMADPYQRMVAVGLAELEAHANRATRGAG